MVPTSTEMRRSQFPDWGRPLDPNVGFVEIEAQAMLPEGIWSFLDQDNKVMFIRAGREGLLMSGFE